MELALTIALYAESLKAACAAVPAAGRLGSGMSNELFACCDQCSISSLLRDQVPASIHEAEQVAASAEETSGLFSSYGQYRTFDQCLGLHLWTTPVGDVFQSRHTEEEEVDLDVYLEVRVASDTWCMVAVDLAASVAWNNDRGLYLMPPCG